jgi:cytochrome P450
MSDVDETQGPPDTAVVEDWTSDYDIFDSEYITDPYPIWSDLRNECPVAHTERWGGSWLPTKYEDVVAMARMVPELSSEDPIVVRPPEAAQQILPGGAYHTVNAPPISADPPVHTWSRRLLLPAFSPKATDGHEQGTIDLCNALIDGFIDRGRFDGAVDYAQQIPPRVIANLMGINPDDADQFVDWVRGTLELGLSNPAIREKYRGKIAEFFMAEIADRHENPRDDLISQLLEVEIDGERISDEHVQGTCNLMLVAGIDTTWSSIGSAIWHLASHPHDRQRLVDEPAVIPTAVEEFLRAYSPVTMARVVSDPDGVDYKGCPMAYGDKILMNFPGANRDPEVFEHPDDVVIDRERNRHIAFGVGIHRCAGSNLARMEMRVAIEELLKRIPEFSLEDPSAVTWAGGQVRGPRILPLIF